jgi:hypothetical protein
VDAVLKVDERDPNRELSTARKIQPPLLMPSGIIFKICRASSRIAASRDASSDLWALENFSQGIGLMPEQIWDGPELPSQYLHFGGTTDAAMPLLWAHSEYVKLASLCCRSKGLRFSRASIRSIRHGRRRTQGHRNLEVESSSANRAGRHSFANPSKFSVSLALDE